GVDQGMFGRGVEKVRGVSDDELVERGAAGHHDGRRSARSPSGAAGALPGGRNRPWIARQDGDVERADIDAQLESVRGDDSPDGTVTKALLDLTTVVGQIAAPVATDTIRGAWHSPEVVLQIRRENLGGQAALRKHDELKVAPEKFTGDAPRFHQVRAPYAQL